MSAAPDNGDFTYPEAARLDLVEQLPAGAPAYAVADPYRWLEDAASDQIVGWSRAQDELFAQVSTTWTGRPHLRSRVAELLRAGVVSAPTWRGQQQFFLRRLPDEEHAVLLTVDPDGGERVLVDPMSVDPSGATTLDAWQPSKEGSLLAYQLSEGGREESVLRVMDVSTGQIVDGPIDRARYSPVAWLVGGQAFFYVRRLAPELLPEDERQFHRRIWLHRIGTDPERDVLVFGDGLDMTNYYGVHCSWDGRWLSVTASAGTAPRTEAWLADLEATGPEQPEFVVVQSGVDAQTSLFVSRDGRAYVSTDRDAPRGRLAVVDPTDPAVENWVDLLPEDPEAVLEDFAILDGPELDGAGVLLAAWTRHAVSEVTVHDLETGERRGSVELPGVGTIGGLGERAEGGHECWFGYTDSGTPSSVLHYDARSGALGLWATAPGTVDVPEVTSQLVEYPSKDGTTVRMLVIAPALAPAAPAPTVLYGYGGFGIPIGPGYSAGVLAWVEAGGVYAMAQLRGGGEEGEDWHRAGMMAHKQNVFDDFHAAAEHLVATGWTTPEQLAISGGSNGGLLVGAALTQRPELYRAVVCSAPLLDMVRYELFGLGATWAEEYGTASDPEQLGWLLGYSPYHHVTEDTPYPAVLLTVFDGDTRVDTMHARKFVAALQHSSASDPATHPVLLRLEKDVGHGGRAVSRSVELSADTLAFMAHHLGLLLPNQATER
ncbi:MAG: prolyl oligopeptidase family serine peptidase [Actinomycetales bacterium]